MKLHDHVVELSGVGEKYAQKLIKIGIETIHDLLYHIPSRYLDFSTVVPINKAAPEQTVTITGEVWGVESVFTKKGKRITKVLISDGTGTLQLIWFNQLYIAKALKQGDLINASGQIMWWDRHLAMIAPFWQKNEDNEKSEGTILSIYPETEGITSAWFRKIIRSAWNNYSSYLEDSLPESLRVTYNLFPVEKALHTLHFPQSTKALAQTYAARYRLAFDEMLALQQKAYEKRKVWEQQPSVFQLVKKKENKKIESAINLLPFTLTQAQHQSLTDILEDITKPYPMNRMLQGDVGSGKTIVAALAAYATKLSGHPTFFMAPTEVLADQHYQTFSSFLTEHGITIALVSGSTKTEGFEKADVLIGTHALFHQDEKLPQAGLVIIDEQHKFGVEQRAKLVFREGYKTPHILTMTATPIPRSIALTVYGEQDMSIIDELPTGRKPIKTWVVAEEKRDNCYNWIYDELKDAQEKKQVLVIYPLIEDSEHESLEDVKAAVSGYQSIQTIFSAFNVALIHGRLGAKEKNTIADEFRNGISDILVSTSVVEVGIDAPHASIIVIENAERFGLATLHQLRGRVGRRNQQAYCFLFTPTDDPQSLQRLKAMEKIHNGMKLAEIDLEIRGPGQVFGTKQHGVGELRFAKITDLELIKKTREAVGMMVK